MIEPRLQRAVLNNVVWCDTVCRTHGIPGVLREAIWVNRGQTPPFYPNAITLAPNPIAAQRERIGELLRLGLRGEWAVKDSFATLDLESLGFEIVFDGAWIYRSPGAALPDSPAPSRVHWVRIAGERYLAAWESAWWGDAAVANEQERIFLPTLLDAPRIAILAAVAGREIVGGAIANETGSVVGLSNLFVPAAGSLAHRAACLAAVTALFRGRALVGYEAGTELEEMLALGFEACGPVRIWLGGGT